MIHPELEQLRDIHLPPAPLLAAVQEGWWIAVLLLAAFAAGAWALRFRRRRLRAARRELSRLADRYAREGDGPKLAADLSLLLRRYAVVRYPGAAVAGLTGDDWLAFLDAHGGEGGFARGVGAALASLPYRAQGDVDGRALVALVRRWLEANPS